MYENDYENEQELGYTEDSVQDGLMSLLEGWDDSFEISRVTTFENAGVMTYNKGLVITMPDGTEFQLTIVQSR